MILKSTNFHRHAFSIFKKKCQPIQQQKYNSCNHLYRQLSSFESSLTELEQKRKMAKKLEDFSKKFRRLYRQDSQQVLSIPMQLNHTYQFYLRKADEMVFGPEDQELQTNLDQLLAITKSMSQLSLTIYLQQLLPIIHEKTTLFQAIEQRFINIEERLSRILFKDYTSFSTFTSKLSFLEERQYKGDFKFVLIDDLATIQKASQCLYHCAQFKHLRSKLVLACQLAINTLHSKLSQQALARFIYCLAISGRPSRVVESNFNEISSRLRNFPLELLLYAAICQINDVMALITILNSLEIQPKNSSEQFLYNAIKLLIQVKYNLKMQVRNNYQPILINKKHGGQLFFQNFLQRYQYKYTTIPNELMYHQIYNIQDKHFICLDHRLASTETLKLNGLGLMYKQYFVQKGLSLKHINWLRMLPMDKRTLRDQYILSKFKGIEKPKIKKVRFYD